MKSFYASLLLCLLSFAAFAQKPTVDIVGVQLSGITYTGYKLPPAASQAPTLLVRQDLANPTTSVYALAYLYDSVAYAQTNTLAPFATFTSVGQSMLPAGQLVSIPLAPDLPFANVTAHHPVYLIVNVYTYYDDNKVGSVAVRRFRVTPPSPLPVNLVTFTGTLKDKLAVVKWKTASETNVDRFVVEMAGEPDKFNAVGQVPARNTSTGGNYQFSLFTHSPLIYLRLKVLDLDGSFRYSPVVTLQDVPTGTYALRVGRFSFEFPLAASDSPTAFIWRTMTGQVVNTGETPSAMAPGVYVVTMVTRNHVTTTKRVLVEN